MSADPVLYLHIGAPKTGTTYLQRVLANHRKELAAQGLLYPGTSSDHFLPAQDVMGHAFRGHPDERAAGTWSRMVREILGWQGSSLVSHELFCLAGSDQIERIMRDLDGREVSVILTARDLVRQIPAVWQEDLKNGKALTLTEFAKRIQSTATKQNQTKGFWGYQHLPRILRRWEPWIDPHKINVVTVPPSGSAPDLLWNRFAETIKVSLPTEALTVKSSNASLGAAAAEFLRLVNVEVGDSMAWPQYRDQVKRGLVRRVLAKAGNSQPIELPESVVDWAAKTSSDLAAELGSRGYHVVGTLSDLTPGEDVQSRAQPVDQEAVSLVGAAAVADLLDHGTSRGKPERGASSPRNLLRVIDGLRGDRGHGSK